MGLQIKGKFRYHVNKYDLNLYFFSILFEEYNMIFIAYTRLIGNYKIVNLI